MAGNLERALAIIELLARQGGSMQLAAIADTLAARDVGFAYGTLAAGGELLAAEAVLARWGKLHVVLPFNEADFIAHAVRPAGEI